MDEKIKPMLMQFAEPEYMCKCGYKFYVYSEKPKHCACCNMEFDWKKFDFTEEVE